MTSPHHPKGSQPRAISKYGSVSEAARKLGVTRQDAKRILNPSRFQFDSRCAKLRPATGPHCPR
jgi:hypothetical protein